MTAIPNAQINILNNSADGKSYSIEVTSNIFKGLSRVKQHKLVYDSLKDAILNGQIHALSIVTKI